MKKIVLCFLIVLFICQFGFAAGNSENTSAEAAQTKNTADSIANDSKTNPTIMHYPAMTTNMLGSAMNSLTATIALALSPFPSITAKFYNLVGEGSYSQIETTANEKNTEYQDINTFAKANTLLSNNAFNQYSVSEKYRWLLQTDTGNNSVEKNRWGLIFWLVVAFTIMELIYLVVFPQKDESSIDLRVIVVKILQSFLIVMLLACLPYLLEATRYGFMQVVSTFARTPQKVKDATGVTRTVFPSAKTFSFLTMTGYYAYSMSSLMDYTDPSNINLFGGESLSDVLTPNRVLVSKLGDVFLAVVYIVFQIILLLITLRAMVHISAKVIESYLLLTLVMLTVPFSIFTPLKSIGEKGLMALAANTIELFVIAIILAILIPAFTFIMVPFLEGIKSSMPFAQLEVTYTKGNSNNTHTDLTLHTLVDDSGVVIVYYARSAANNNNAGTGLEKYLIYTENYSGSSIESYLKDTEQNKFNNAQKVTLSSDGSVRGNGVTFDNNSEMYKIGEVYKSTLMNMYDKYSSDSSSVTDEEKARTMEAKLTSENYNRPILRTEFLSDFNASIANKLGYPSNGKEEVANYRGMDRINLMIRHILFCTMALLLPSYFVRLSSSLTNAILSGGTTHSDIAREVALGMTAGAHMMASTLSPIGNAMKALAHKIAGGDKPRHPTGGSGADGSPADNV